jgi:hypothetical protein
MDYSMYIYTYESYTKRKGSESIPRMALRVLSAIDTTKTQLYHFKAIGIAGMGLYTDAYDLFCILLN